MSKLVLSEIVVGLVAFLDQTQLNQDPEVHRSLRQHHGCLRPFVCVWCEGGESQWLPLTTRPRPERLRIERPWRSGGEVCWRVGDDHYLNDGANIYKGPDSAFVDASHSERTDWRSRARVSADGIEAIRAEMQRQNHRRQDTGDAA